MPEQSDHSVPSWGKIGWAAVAVAFAIGFIGFPLRVVGHRAEYLPGDPLDTRLNNFVLEHGYQCLAGRVGVIWEVPYQFWNAPMFYPARGATAWSDTHLGMLPVYALLRAVGLSPEGAFQGYFFSGFVLNFAAAVWALRRLGFGAVGTAAGAFVFTFGLPLVAQLTHVQLYPRFLVPPAVVFGWEFLRAPRTRTLAGLAAYWVGQMYLTVYVAYFLVLLLAAGGVFAALRYRSSLPWGELLRPGRSVWKARTAVAAGALFAVLPLLTIHALSAGRVPVETLRQMAPRPGAWVTPPDTIATFPELADWTGLHFEVQSEQQLYPGVVPLLAVAGSVFFLVKPRAFGTLDTAAGTAGGVVLLLALFVTAFDQLWPYEPVTRLPGAAGIRAVGRIVIVLLFPAGIAVATFADRLVGAARKFGRIPAALAACAVLAAAIGDQWLTATDGPRQAAWEPMRYSREAVVARQTQIANAIREHPAPRMVYVFPSAGGPKSLDTLILQLDAMRASQDLGMQCVNGYSGYLALGWDQFRNYRTLIEWLTEKNHVSKEELAGLIVLGEPEPDADPQYEAKMRAAYPPRKLGPDR